MARYYLTWREKILGGYVVVIAGLSNFAGVERRVRSFDEKE